MEIDLCRLCAIVSPYGCFPQALANFLHRAEHDQELDSLFVGPVPIGTNKFVFEADPPNTANIPSSEVIGVTVILLTCSYDGREFVRVGYYVNNEYTDETLAENPPSKPVIEKIRRNILAEKPRVTRFAIKWCVFDPFQPHSAIVGIYSCIEKPRSESHSCNPIDYLLWRSRSSQNKRIMLTSALGTLKPPHLPNSPQTNPRLM